MFLRVFLADARGNSANSAWDKTLLFSVRLAWPVSERVSMTKSKRVTGERTFPKRLRVVERLFLSVSSDTTKPRFVFSHRSQPCTRWSFVSAAVFRVLSSFLSKRACLWLWRPRGQGGVFFSLFAQTVFFCNRKREKRKLLNACHLGRHNETARPDARFETSRWTSRHRTSP